MLAIAIGIYLGGLLLRHLTLGDAVALAKVVAFAGSALALTLALLALVVLK